jgi:hypothetical protein
MRRHPVFRATAVRENGMKVVCHERIKNIFFGAKIRIIFKYATIVVKKNIFLLRRPRTLSLGMQNNSLRIIFKDKRQTAPSSRPLCLSSSFVQSLI